MAIADANYRNNNLQVQKIKLRFVEAPNCLSETYWLSSVRSTVTNLISTEEIYKIFYLTRMLSTSLGGVASAFVKKYKTYILTFTLWQNHINSKASKNEKFKTKVLRLWQTANVYRISSLEKVTKATISKK